MSGCQGKKRNHKINRKLPLEMTYSLDLIKNMICSEINLKIYKDKK